MLSSGTISQQLLLFVILKGKRWKNDRYTKEFEADDRISQSQNGKADNKLCIKWIEKRFEPATKSHLLDKYCFLIVDRHISHISIEFLKLTMAN